MVKGKGTSKPYVSFIGNSAIDVTGSMHLIRFKKYVTLLDCGLIQLNDPFINYKRNAEQLKKIKPKEIDYIILSHCHIDHSGLIPALYAKGCQAHVYVPEGSIPFLRLLWEDSMKIMESDCKKLSNHGLKANPFYTIEDINKAINRCIEVNYFKEQFINQDMYFEYYPAGHIIHSAQIVLTLNDSFVKKRIGYTGDIGQGEREFVRPRENLPFVDLLIGENTYNYPTRPNKIKDRIKDFHKILTVCDEANKILIPTFSLGRTQEMLSLFYTFQHVWHWIDMEIYLDSPLSQKICEAWNDEYSQWHDNYFKTKVMTMPNLHIIKDWNESKVLQNEDKHCIIIAASGFLNGGRALAHLKTMLSNKNNHVIFCGFSGENNLASQIKNRHKIVKIDNEYFLNNAGITCLYSFSSHASYEELLKYYTDIRYNKIAIVHGDMKYKASFCNILQDELYRKGKASKVVCVNNGTKIYI